MVLGYYGRHTPIAETRAMLSPGRDGNAVLALTRVARRLGLHTRIVSVDVDRLAALPAPAILHWQFRHFLVLERFTAHGADVVDPAVGRRRLSAAELDANFTGVVLMFEPTPALERRKARKRRRVLSFLRELFLAPDGRDRLPQIVVLSLLSQAAGLVLPLATGAFVDHFVPRREVQPTMLLLGAVMLCVALAYGVATYLRGLLLVWLQARCASDATLAFAEHLLRLPLPFFQQRSSGDLLLRLDSNTVVRETLTVQTITTLIDGMLVLGYLAILFACDVRFGLATLTLAALQAGWFVLTFGRQRYLAAAELNAQSAAQACASETLKGIATVKAMAGETRVFEYWSRLLVRQVKLSMLRGHAAAAVDAVSSTLRLLGPLALLWFGGMRVLTGDISLGTLFALLALAAGLLGPLSSVLNTLTALGQVEAHLERLADVLEAEPEPNGSALPAPLVSGRIDLHELAFQYAADAPLVVDHVSLSIEAGQKVAFVGATGSGKSTLALLLLGLLQPTRGTVRYDGVDVRRLNLTAVRRQIGTVLQEPIIFSGSVRQAIAFHAPDLDLESVRRAARLATIDDEITVMPLGYDTLLSEAGGGMSGGQRQRLALARALVHSPRVLLLDEATSQLDVETEQRIEHNLRQLCCTRIVIAHRLSTIVDSDLICVLDRGRIVERGTHAELLGADGMYAAMWRTATSTRLVAPMELAS